MQALHDGVAYCGLQEKTLKLRLILPISSVNTVILKDSKDAREARSTLPEAVPPARRFNVEKFA